MVLQIFNEALQCVIYRVMAGAGGSSPECQNAPRLRGCEISAQEGREETTAMHESQGLAK